MLEFFLFLIGGVGYSLYFDLNPLEAILVALVVLALVLRRGRDHRPSKARVPKVWRIYCRLARRRKTAVAAVFVFALAIRAALLPLLPVPKPMIPDEFGHLLIADTLTHGRLTNPTHPMWMHFESLHIFQQPTYNSDFFPGQGAVLALGKLAGHPWIAVWVLCAAMCAALCWMLQGWVPPQWALLGALIAVFRFGVASYWINSYYGGCLAAIGGALVLGAIPRLRCKPSLWYALAFGFGLIVIGYSRPFEGLAVALPAVAALGYSVIKKRTPTWISIPVAALACAGVVGLLVYSKAVTGDPLRTPYAVNQATYGWPMTLPWVHTSEPRFRHIELQRYYDYEKETHDSNSSLAGEIKNSTLKAQSLWRFFFGPALSIPLILLPRVWRKPRLRLLLIAGALTVVAALTDTGTMPHYAAVGTGCFLAILVLCFRELSRQRYGIRLTAAALSIMLLILGVRIGLEQFRLPFTQKTNFFSWCCVAPMNPNKAPILAMLEKNGGKHLVIVKPKSDPQNLFQWIYNDADIDASPVVWARDMGADLNRPLIDYFRDRKVWLVDPNLNPPLLTPYPASGAAGENAAYQTDVDVSPSKPGFHETQHPRPPA